MGFHRQATSLSPAPCFWPLARAPDPGTCRQQSPTQRLGYLGTCISVLALHRPQQHPLVADFAAACPVQSPTINPSRDPRYASWDNTQHAPSPCSHSLRFPSRAQLGPKCGKPRREPLPVWPLWLCLHPRLAVRARPVRHAGRGDLEGKRRRVLSAGPWHTLRAWGELRDAPWALPQHWVAYSLESYNGTTRHNFNAIVSAYDLQDTYFPGW